MPEGSEKVELGRGGRLRGSAAPELVEAAYAREAAHGPALASALSAADIAHALALVESGAVAEPDASALLAGLLELEAVPGDEFPWDAELGDAFVARESELRGRVGPAAAGWLSAGRPRREAFRVALRLVARDGAAELALASLDLADALVDRAEATADDLAADYTYLQPAQPSTVGHLILSYAYPALRDAERLSGLDTWLGASPAGAGGSAGSRWPLDRERLAGLLGFATVARHVRDAMWQADGYAELAAFVAIAATHQSQLAQDLEILASNEFAFVELADEHSRASALMPQKRNPYALAAIRTQAGIATGDSAAIQVTLHTGSARTDHFHLLNGSIPRVLSEASSITRLSAAVVRGLRIDTERWGEAARRGGTAAADVADLVASATELDYRTAHKVVGRAVRDLTDAGRPLGSLGADELKAAAREVSGN
ncbi:MAG: lyase family protein, partial [Miltoncostaeaceae bacterium]